MSNFLAGAFDSVRRGALVAARRALPQHCELCAGRSGDALICADCARDLPRLGPACPVCALPTQEGSTCGHCLAHPPPFTATYAAFVYGFPVDRLIQRLKYQGRLALCEWAAAAIVETSDRTTDADRPDRLFALPLAAERQRERGYNQSYEIARAVAAATGIALASDGARRVRATPPQTALPWSERAKNVRGAFACEVGLEGESVAVIDDVMTTGASLAEFARTLLKAGAARVENWVVARTLPPAG